MLLSMIIQLMIFIEGSNLALLMMCNVTSPLGPLFCTIQIYVANWKILINQVTLEYNQGLTINLVS